MVFDLTDNRASLKRIQNEVHYCVFCHKSGSDYCSKGFLNKKNDFTSGFKKNPLDVVLAGCPLDEKISEMQWLRAKGYNIAALAGHHDRQSHVPCDWAPNL